MAITSSAKKAHRAGKKKQVFNSRRKNLIDDKFKELRRLIAAKDKAGAIKHAPSVYQALDKAVKTHYIKENTASRLKSRAMAAISRIAK